MAAKAPVRRLCPLKRARQDEKRELRNQSKTNEIKTYVKKLEAALRRKTRKQSVKP